MKGGLLMVHPAFLFVTAVSILVFMYHGGVEIATGLIWSLVAYTGIVVSRGSRWRSIEAFYGPEFSSHRRVEHHRLDFSSLSLFS